MATFQEQVRTCTALNLSPVGTGGGNAVDAISIVPVANAAAADKVTITNASFGQATTLTIPDPGVSNASLVLAPSGSSVALTATVTMNASTVISAYATPVQLVPSPGSGLCVFVQAAYVSTHKGSSAFATGTAPIIQYGSTAHGAGTAATASGLSTNDIEATTDQTRNLLPIATGAQTGLSNAGIYFSCGTAYTGGTGSTVSITLVYTIVSSDN
jgi:hypothetical protein